jgi:hypothetical protein
MPTVASARTLLREMFKKPLLITGVSVLASLVGAVDAGSHFRGATGEDYLSGLAYLLGIVAVAGAAGLASWWVFIIARWRAGYRTADLPRWYSCAIVLAALAPTTLLLLTHGRVIQTVYHSDPPLPLWYWAVPPFVVAATHVTCLMIITPRRAVAVRTLTGSTSAIAATLTAFGVHLAL